MGEPDSQAMAFFMNAGDMLNIRQALMIAAQSAQSGKGLVMSYKNLQPENQNIAAIATPVVILT